MDSRFEIWDNKSLTAIVHSYTAENFFDMEENGVTDESLSELLYLNIKVGTAFAGLAAGCYFAALTSDSATFASGVRCLAALGCEDYPVLVTELTAGAEFSLAFPCYNLHKYLEVYWNNLDTVASAGTVDVWFGFEPIGPLKVQKYPS
jgi:hypothetical protein